MTTYCAEPCWRCGHPATYHGVTFCLYSAGAEHKRPCDCAGYADPRLLTDGRTFGGGA